MAGYGLKSFLIAQSLNQIEKAYGQNNSILDNCHVRVSFATNDERTAKRVSDALGMATELRAMKNYAGSRLSPWLGHLMISRQETARPLLTPGRGHAASAGRRNRHGLRQPANPREEGALLRGWRTRGPHSFTAGPLGQSNAALSVTFPQARPTTTGRALSRQHRTPRTLRIRTMPGYGVSPNCPSMRRSLPSPERRHRNSSPWTTSRMTTRSASAPCSGLSILLRDRRRSTQPMISGCSDAHQAYLSSST